MMSVFSWLVTYLIHSTLLLLGAWLCDRFLLRGRPHWQEIVWRVALVGGLLTATAQAALPVRPYGGTFSLASLDEKTPKTSADLGPVTAIVIHAPNEPATVLISRRSRPAIAAANAHPPRLFPWQTVALSAWAIGAIAMLGALGLSWKSFRKRLEVRRRLEGERIGDVLADLAARRPMVRAPLISATDEVSVPMALGLRQPEILLPERVALELSAEAQESVLAHELGHIVRRDPLYRLIAAIFVRVFFFQPLNFLAARKLAAAAELLADDWAAERTARPLDLAECLTKVARWAMAGAPSVLVPAMALGTSELRQRVERLVKGEWLSMKTKRTVWAGPIATLLLTGLYLLAPCASGVAEAKDKPPKAPPMLRVGPPAPPLPPSPPRVPGRTAGDDIEENEDEDQDEPCEAKKPEKKKQTHAKQSPHRGRHAGPRFGLRTPWPMPPPVPHSPHLPRPPMMVEVDDFDVFVQPPEPPDLEELEDLEIDVDVDVDTDELEGQLEELHEQMGELREKLVEVHRKAREGARAGIEEAKQARKQAEKARHKAEREAARAKRRAQKEREERDEDTDDEDASD